MNNKGFTLVELLAAVTIMLMITMIAIPTSMKIIERGKQKQYDILESQIISAASKYYIKHKDTVANKGCIPYSEIINDIDEKFIISGNQINNPKTNTVLSGHVEVVIGDNKVNYKIIETGYCTY